MLEKNHENRIMNRPSCDENKQGGNGAVSISSQAQIEAIEKMAYPRVPHPPAIVESRLRPAVQQYPLQEQEFAGLGTMTAKTQGLALAGTRSPVDHLEFSVMSRGGAPLHRPLRQPHMDIPTTQSS